MLIKKSKTTTKNFTHIILLACVRKPGVPCNKHKKNIIGKLLLFQLIKDIT